MKKSTILMLVVVYIVAFFIVGLLGMQLRSHYSVTYLNEIQVTPFAESGVVEEVPPTTTKHGNEDDPSHLRIEHEYFFTVQYHEDIVLRFNVVMVPTETTDNNYLLFVPEKNPATITKDEVDKSLTISNISKPGKFFDVGVEFTLTDTKQNGVKSHVHLTVHR